MNREIAVTQPWMDFQPWWTRGEEELIGYCALRFDGGKYEEMLDPVPDDGTYARLSALHQKLFSRSFALPDDLLPCFGVFFWLQRSIKWTGDLIPRNWVLYQWLFVNLHDKRVPEEFRFGGRYEDYQRDCLRDAAGIAARLRPIVEEKIAGCDADAGECGEDAI